MLPIKVVTFIAILLPGTAALLAQPATSGAAATGGNWYEKSFYLLHLDHHTRENDPVGKDADSLETARLIGLSKPDVIQIHTKGRPGWTTYPSGVGHVPPHLARDVIRVWRDIARKDGYRFSAYYNLGRDSEVMQRKPEWNRQHADGTPQDAALCYHSGVAEGYLWPMIDEIMTMYQPNGFWFDGSAFTVKNCYCRVCRNRFRSEQGLEAPVTPQSPGWAAYKEMQRQIYREFVQKTVDRIKAKNAACLVAVNMAFSTSMPESSPAGIDYLTADFGNEVEALSPMAHWYDSQDKPFDLMTTIFLADGKASTPKPAPQMEQEMALIIANGGRYFAWDNPTKGSGLVPERHAFLSQVVSPFLRARQEWCVPSKRVPDVSLLFSSTAHYAATQDLKDCFKDARYFFVSTADELSRAHLNYEMISDDRLEASDIRSPLLLVENPAALSEKNLAAIRRYATGGGTVLMTGKALALEGAPGLLGLQLLAEPAAPENWTVLVANHSGGLTHQVYRTKPAGGRVLLPAKDSQGKQYPLLTQHRVGKGEIYYVPFPLFTPTRASQVSPALINAVMQRVLPEHRRKVVTNAPPTAEVVLRQQGRQQILHLVNRATGKQDSLKLQYGRPYYKITDIPVLPACHVSLALPAKPTSVKLQPQEKDLQGWTYHRGRLEMDVPGAAIHQMVVVE